MAKIQAVKYKIGQKVLVSPHDYNVFVEDMGEFLGKVVTIKSIERYSAGDYYKIVEDKGKWWWCDNCFESVEIDISDKIYEVLRGQ